MITFLIEDWLNALEKISLSLQWLAVVYNIFFFFLWLYYWLRCVIEWNLDDLQRFRLFNSIIIVLKKQGVLTYLESLKLRNSNISIYLESSETSEHQ